MKRYKIKLIMISALVMSFFSYAQEQMKPMDGLQQFTVTVKSSKDRSEQKILFYAPPESSKKPVPLLVGLHTWSTDYQNSGRYIEDVKKRGWAFVGPDFRGSNTKPEACASEIAIQDVLDAVEYSKKNAKIDEKKIYLVGESGGGHMSLMMASKAPDLWAGVSAWVPISDLAAWHAETKAAKREYFAKLEKVCGGEPGKNKKIDGEYHDRSPIFFLQNAKGLPMDINTGIHDGHTGSVPVSHALRAFNVLAEANGEKKKQISDEDISSMVKNEKVPDSLKKEAEKDPDRKKAVLFRREAGPVRITVFEGSHESDKEAALNWLEKQKKK